LTSSRIAPASPPRGRNRAWHFPAQGKTRWLSVAKGNAFPNRFVVTADAVICRMTYADKTRQEELAESLISGQGCGAHHAFNVAPLW